MQQGAAEDIGRLGCCMWCAQPAQPLRATAHCQRTVAPRCTASTCDPAATQAHQSPVQDDSEPYDRGAAATTLMKKCHHRGTLTVAPSLQTVLRASAASRMQAGFLDVHILTQSTHMQGKVYLQQAMQIAQAVRSEWRARDSPAVRRADAVGHPRHLPRLHGDLQSTGTRPEQCPSRLTT